MAAFVKYKEKEAKAENQGVFIIRGDGRAESLKAFQKELRAVVKTPTDR